MKKIYAVISSVSMVLMPYFVHAQLTMPQSSYGMSTKTLGQSIEAVINFLLGVVGVLALLAIVVSGIIYITSGGESSKTDAAKGWLTYGIVGLVVALLGYMIVKTVGMTFGVR